MSLHRLLALFIFVALASSFSAGCNKPADAPPDPEALKKELDELNKARKQEWKQ